MMRTLGKVDKVLNDELALLSNIKNNGNPANKLHYEIVDGDCKCTNFFQSCGKKSECAPDKQYKIHVNILHMFRSVGYN